MRTQRGKAHQKVGEGSAEKQADKQESVAGSGLGDSLDERACGAFECTGSVGGDALSMANRVVVEAMEAVWQNRCVAQR